MLVVHTQYMENYGFSEGLEHWKCKGGSAFKVLNVTSADDINEVIKKLGIEYFGEASREYVLGYSDEADDFLSETEKLQLEYEGRITYPEKTFDYNEYRNKVA